VLASCAPRPGVGAGERRARPSNSGGVGDADAALKALALRAAKTGARTSALLAVAAVLEHRAPSALAPARPGPLGTTAAKKRSLAALLAELLLHATAARQTTFATEAAEANDFCYLFGDVTNVVTVVTRNAENAADVPGCAPVLGCQGAALRASRCARP